MLSSTLGSGSISGITEAGSTAGPRSSSAASPDASRAAAGANRSLPWNVAPGPGIITSGFSIELMAWAPPIIATAGERRPLSGPTKNPNSVAAAMAAAGGADPRVHDCQHDSRGEILNRPGQGQGAGSHIAGRDAVSDVDDPGLGRQAVDHTVDDSDELVEMPEVRQKADRHRHPIRLGSGRAPGRERRLVQVGTRQSSHMIRGWRSRSIRKLHSNSPMLPR